MIADTLLDACRGHPTRLPRGGAIPRRFQLRNNQSIILILFQVQLQKQLSENDLADFATARRLLGRSAFDNL